MKNPWNRKPLAQATTKRVLIFDGDDTLWVTMPLYVRAKRKFFQLMRKEGYSTQEVEAYFEERDCSNLRTLGFSRRRFGLSMHQTYRHFASLADKEVRKSVDQQIVAIRDQVFDAHPKLVPFAKSVLQSLASRNRLILLTKGTKTIQLQRVSSSGLSHFFERIFVVKDKNNDTFRRLLENLKIRPSNTWSVGDSLRSDINPALRGGLNAIWIPSSNWNYENDVLLPDRRLHKIQSLKQVLPIVDRLATH